MSLPRSLLTFLVAVAAPGMATAATVGSKAPELEPKAWLNHEGELSWSRLRGHLILVERWATW